MPAGGILVETNILIFFLEKYTVENSVLGVVKN